MKKIVLGVLILLVTVPGLAMGQGGNFSAKEFDGLSTQNKLLLMQMAEDSIIRKDAVRLIQYEEKASRPIREGVFLSLQTPY